jgi:hypothetical protein
VRLILPPTIGGFTASRTSVPSGESVTFNVSIKSGTAPLTYTWLKNGKAIAGASNSPTYRVAHVTQNAKYSVQVTNGSGKIIGKAKSKAIAIKVTAAGSGGGTPPPPVPFRPEAVADGTDAANSTDSVALDSYLAPAQLAKGDAIVLDGTILGALDERLTHDDILEILSATTFSDGGTFTYTRTGATTARFVYEKEVFDADTGTSYLETNVLLFEFVSKTQGGYTLTSASDETDGDGTDDGEYLGEGEFEYFVSEPEE